jgi:hypothetical protein
LSALIPGGRREENDDNYSRQIDGEVDYVDDVSLVDGVPPGADLLWESNPRGAHRLQLMRRGVEHSSTTSQSVLLPEMYHPRAAMNAFKNWQDTIWAVAFPGGVGIGGGGSGRGGSSVLQQIVSILVGVVPPLYPRVGNGAMPF